MSARRNRRPFRWLRVLIAFALIAGVNVGVWRLWQDRAPWLTLFPQATSVDIVEDTVDLPVEQVMLADRLDGQTLASRLLSTFPYPGVGWRGGAPSSTPVGLPVDIVCPSDGVAPAIQQNREWRYAGTDIPTEEPPRSVLATSPGSVGGLSAQVRIYPAGLGAVALQDLSDQVAECLADDPWSTTLGWTMELGRQAFSISARGDNANVSIVVFRVGDIVGVVAGRGPIDVPGLATDWEQRWLSVVQDVCANPDSGLADAARQPLFARYEGFRTTEKYRLSAQQKATVEAQVAERVRQDYASAGTSTEEGLLPTTQDGSLAALPAARAGKPGTQLPVKEIPTTTVPDIWVTERPPVPVFPRFPREPKTSSRIDGPAVDVVGPGCGWALTGQQVPTIDEAAAQAEWDAARAEELDRLSRDWAGYIKATWRYAQAYADYTRQVAEWNAWADDTFRRIVVGEWQAYDRQVAEYVLAEETYVQDRAEWNACIDALPPDPVPDPVTPVPSTDPVPPAADPTVVPSPEGDALPVPQPSSTPVTPGVGATPASSAAPTGAMAGSSRAAAKVDSSGCGPEPIPPARPVAPNYPRPVDVPAPVLPTEPTTSPSASSTTNPTVP